VEAMVPLFECVTTHRASYTDPMRSAHLNR
jgi:hypothetical protein